MNRLKHFQRWHNSYGLAMIAVFLFLNALVLASSIVMEVQRTHTEPPFALWEPFIWQFTSAIAVLLLIPLIHAYLNKRPLSWLTPIRSVVIFLVLAIIFSIAHVGLMVGMRKLVYLYQGRSYIFGSLAFEFIYELRKDILTFATLLIISYGYHFIVSRLMNEAETIKEVAEEEPTATNPETTQNKATDQAVTSRDRLLVKKLGKEFIVRLEDVEWMEASGNYINLHIGQRIYPIRKTLSAFTLEIANKGFCRIHRSHSINLDRIDSIISLPSGDGEVTLNSGKVLPISRRYKDELKCRLL
ncbi:LytR/AlgR family response regulator transcription factor [Marinagarivorans algicola]|uniref:LytR/AlgR family response regulator transcription factor n=1 Tax=Marinagarivorans algicola TaxID=1513270 RepID=UPI0006B43858|nr:LytTR family DNA-binding domain-containing protein [Marinagarivorans algicola]